MHRFSAFWHMRLPHRLQGQKVNSQSHGAGAYCGGHSLFHIADNDEQRQPNFNMVIKPEVVENFGLVVLKHSC